MVKSFIRKDFRSILFLSSLVLTIGIIIHIISLYTHGYGEADLSIVVRFVILFIAVSLLFSSLGSLLDARKRERAHR